METKALLLSDFIYFFKDKQESLPYNFNVLDEQCGHIVENSHTNMLIKLLQYKNQYGYVFLTNFFSCLGIDIEFASSDKVVFEREAHYKGVDTKNGRIDGLIYQYDCFALIIENKVNGAGNQQEQLKKYIEGVLQDDKIFSQETTEDARIQKIWVIFLTKDGDEKPDETSLSYMRYLGICSQTASLDEPEGQRYAAVNYHDHILPWLKENIQPCVMQKEQSLNSGLLQYIDFLEGMLGMRASDDKLLEEGKAIINNRLELSRKNFIERNDCLKSLKSFLDNQLKTVARNNGEVINDIDEAILQRQAINTLNNIIEELNEEPLEDFFDITRSYFLDEQKLMKGCNFKHNFHYGFLYFRDNHWPRGVHFEWYSLGTQRLEKGNDYRLCFHVEGSPIIREIFDNNEELKQLFLNQGFIKEDRVSSVAFHKEVPSHDSIINMNRNDLATYLRKTYSHITKEIVDKINELLKEVVKQ